MTDIIMLESTTEKLLKEKLDLKVLNLSSSQLVVQEVFLVSKGPYVFMGALIGENGSSVEYWNDTIRAYIPYDIVNPPDVDTVANTMISKIKDRLDVANGEREYRNRRSVDKYKEAGAREVTLGRLVSMKKDTLWAALKGFDRWLIKHNIFWRLTLPKLFWIIATSIIGLIIGTIYGIWIS